MTVGELKQLLEHVDDRLVVVVSQDAGRAAFFFGREAEVVRTGRATYTAIGDEESSLLRVVPFGHPEAKLEQVEVLAIGAVCVE